MSPDNQKLLEISATSGALGIIGATLRIIANKMSFGVALATLITGVGVSMLVGLGLDDYLSSPTVKSAIIGASGICAKEILELLIRIASKIRDKSDVLADKVMNRFDGESK